MTWATWSVIVKKTHPRATSRSAASRIHTSRETGTSWRFRQRPRERFVVDSMRALCVTEHVCFVRGRLKPGARWRGRC